METISPDMSCRDCTALRAEVEALKDLLVALRQQVDALQSERSQAQAELAQTQAALLQTQAQLAAARKNSSNSSKPPSSDIVKPKQPASPGRGKRKRKRKIGGQPGHRKHERTFSLSDADQQHLYGQGNRIKSAVQLKL